MIHCIYGHDLHQFAIPSGFPLATLLHSDKKYSELCGDATVTVCHRYTPADQLVVMTRHADIVISATGEEEVGGGGGRRRWEEEVGGGGGRRRWRCTVERRGEEGIGCLF